MVLKRCYTDSEGVIIMENLLIVGVVLNLLLLVYLLYKLTGERAFSEQLRELSQSLETLQRDNQRLQEQQRQEMSRGLQDSLGAFGTMIVSSVKASGDTSKDFLKEIGAHQQLLLETSLTELREELRQTRQLVDEKLQKTLNERMTESFKLVNDRLEAVYKGLGEMQSLAQGVGDLKKVMSNVKTRGILGEIQLQSILEDILAKEQYEQNVATKKGSKAVVEFAVKLPAEDGSFLYLPIDSKFPGETYGYLRDAYESGDAARIKECAKALFNTLRSEAKDIHDKYIDAPHTTDFAIMFLPFEGLYAEAVNNGLVEVLQREYQVNIAGPSTMAALLNSLQMSFRTFAIQKRSGEVWQVLGAVKTEFDKFAATLEAAQTKLNQANEELDRLVGVRTRKMQSKLRGITELDDLQSEKILETK